MPSTLYLNFTIKIFECIYVNALALRRAALFSLPGPVYSLGLALP